MEDQNYEFLNSNSTIHSINSNYFSEIIDNPNELSFSEVGTRSTKLEPLVEDETGEMFNINDCDDIVYSFDDEISSTFTSSFSTSNNFHSTISLLSESPPSHTLDNLSSVPDLIAESPFTDSRSALLSNNHPGELKKLLKVDVLSPVSFGSSYQSVNENLSIDSSQSNLTIPATVNPTGSSDVCVICSDLATGKHYGVSACEGCKGFFKRTIRKRLHYSCREQNTCPITERLRNRCQSCRFNKCLDKGMKVEAVQKERTLKQMPSSTEVKFTCVVPIITAEDVLQNEVLFYHIEKSECNSLTTVEVGETKLLCSIINKQLFNLVMWAKSIPGFSYLERSDQMILLNTSWVEILITSFSFLSSIEPEFGCIKMDNVHKLTLSVAAELGLQNLMVRILRELIITLKHLQVDQMEIACLKTIILFDSTYNNLKNTEIIKQFRYHVFDILKKYVSEKYPRQPSRIYKLLLKLPSIRGLTTCFITKMKLILYDSLLIDNLQQSPLSETNSGELENHSRPDLLYPLFAEMMKHKDYPYL